ncbi:MAG: 3-hydroxyacyl-CoA dehydrogenase family protein [Pseudomonadota bacterium]
MVAPLSVGIIGAGLMGHGIAQVFAAAGDRVRVHDTSADSLATLNARIEANLIALGQDPAAAQHIEACSSLAAAVADADLVIEAAPEKLELKRKIFEALEEHAPAGAILASNTSVIPITAITGALRSAERAIGTHWWNPAYLIPLVEVIESPRTAPAVVQRTIDLLQELGKTPVHVRKDVPGFVGNRLQHALWREAMALVQERVCDAETVDTVVKASFGRRLAVLGPLENADLVGLDLTLDIHQHVLPALDRTPEPLAILHDKVAEGDLGMKTGRGFRHWTDDQAAALHEGVVNHLKQFDESATPS